MSHQASEVTADRFETGQLLRDASKRESSDNFGSLQFKEGLERIVKSTLQEARLSTYGMGIFREQIIGSLVKRLKNQKILEKVPSISQIPTPKPLVILSLPRSGSTLLHNLFALDDSARAFRTWELMSPTPPDLESRHLITEDRIKHAESFIVKMALLGFQKLHPLSLFGPDHCRVLMTSSFMTANYCWRFYCPSYRKWLETSNLDEAYNYLKTQIQLLLWQRPCPPNGHIILNSPEDHMRGVRSILRAFPDACFVYVSRDLKRVIPSTCATNRISRLSINGSDDSNVPMLDRSKVGLEWLLSLKSDLSCFKREVDSLSDNEKKKILRLEYEDLVADPVNTVQEIYRYFDYEFSPQLAERMGIWLAQNRQASASGGHYKLIDFGLTEEQVDEHFSS